MKLTVRELRLMIYAFLCAQEDRIELIRCYTDKYTGKSKNAKYTRRLTSEVKRMSKLRNKIVSHLKELKGKGKG